MSGSNMIEVCTNIHQCVTIKPSLRFDMYIFFGTLADTFTFFFQVRSSTSCADNTTKVEQCHLVYTVYMESSASSCIYCVCPFWVHSDMILLCTGRTSFKGFSVITIACPNVCQHHGPMLPLW